MILVVDDEPIYQKLITNALKGTGDEFDIAEDGYAAIDKIQKNRYELAIIDLVLPGPVNGNDIVKRIKKINPETVVIVCSGYANQSIVTKSEKAGADSFLIKPFNPEQLQQKVAQFLPQMAKKAETVASVVPKATTISTSAELIAPPVEPVVETEPDISVVPVTPEKTSEIIPYMLVNLPKDIIEGVLLLGIEYELQVQERQTVNFTESITFILSGQTECYYDDLPIGQLNTADSIGYESLMKNIDPMAYIEIEAIENTRLCIVSKIEFLKFFCGQTNDYISLLEKNVRKILPQNPLLNTDYYKK